MNAGGNLLDVAGWLLLAVCFLLPFVVRDFQQSARLATAYLMITLIRQAMTINRAYFELPLSDAGDLHRAATSSFTGEITYGAGARPYVALLSRAYETLGESWLVGQQLSNLAFALACIAFVKFVREIGVTRHVWVLLVLFSCSLTTFRYTTTTVREPYQILFFVLAALWALRFKRTGNVLAFVPFALSAFVMALFHDGLLVYALLLIGLVLVWPVGLGPHRAARARRTAFPRAMILVPVVVLGAFLATRAFSKGLVSAQAIYALAPGDAVKYAAFYRQQGMVVEGRSSYGVALDASSPGEFVASFASVFAHYLAGPFPWEIRAPEDVYGASESVLRMLLLVFAIREVSKRRGPARRMGAMFLAAYIVLTALWALGTVNYGTAIRHHLTSNWILIAFGGAGAVTAFSGYLAGMTSSQRHGTT